jgi:hypothetical protein
MFNVDFLTPFIVFSVIIEQLVEVGFTLIEKVPGLKDYVGQPNYKEWKKIATFISAVVLGGALGYLLQLDIVAAVGLETDLPAFLTFIVTGVLVGAGAPFIHGIIKVFNAFASTPVDYDQIVKDVKDQLEAELNNL